MNTIHNTHSNTDVSTVETTITANHQTIADYIEIKICISGNLELPLTKITDKLELVTFELSNLVERNHVKLNVDSVRDSLTNCYHRETLADYLNHADSITHTKIDNLGRVERLTAELCSTLAKYHVNDHLDNALNSRYTLGIQSDDVKRFELYNQYFK